MILRRLAEAQMPMPLAGPGLPEERLNLIYFAAASAVVVCHLDSVRAVLVVCCEGGWVKEEAAAAVDDGHITVQ